MPAQGKRYPLLIYQLMINRWWPPILTLGIVMVATVTISWASAWLLPLGKNPIPIIPDFTGIIVLAAGFLAIVFAIILMMIRSQAYIQPFGTYLRVNTPFLRFNISYKRFMRTYSATISTLFPPRSLSKRRREIIAPLGSKTAIVVELRGFPVSANTLRTFLSTFFFKDKTTHIVLLVKDWMQLSTEIESMKTGGAVQADSQKRPRRAGLLTNLNRGDR